MVIVTINVYAENSEQDTCEYKKFDNVYYLLDKHDYASASFFFHNIPSLKKDEFLVFPGAREVASTYYDFEDLVMLNVGKELIYTLDENLPEYFLEREQVKYIDKFTEQLNITNFEIKRYNKKTSFLDKHPLFGRIKRKERSFLIETLFSFSENSPELIKEMLKVESTDRIYFVIFYGNTVGTITMSHFTVLNFSVPNTSLLFKIEKTNENNDELTIDERTQLESYFCRVNNDFKLQFPDTKSFSWFGYEQYNKIAVDNFPNRKSFMKSPELYLIGQIICLSFIGFLIISFLLGRYSRLNTSRYVFRKNKK